MPLPSLDGLDDEQLGQVLQHLFAHYDTTEEFDVSEAEIAERTKAETAYLSEAAVHAGVTAGPAPTLREVIEEVAVAVPETITVIESAAARARRAGSLPSPGFGVDVLLIAAAVAILRPRLHIRKPDFELKAELGDPKMARLLEAVTRFLNGMLGPKQ